MVLSQYVANQIDAIVEVAHSKGISFGQAEQEVMGLSHAEVGAVLAEKWELPNFLVGAIRAHHMGATGNGSGSGSDETTTLAATCILANQLTRETGSGVGANETPDPELPSFVPEILGVKPAEYEDIQELLRKEIEDTMTLLGGGKDEDDDG